MPARYDGGGKPMLNRTAATGKRGCQNIKNTTNPLSPLCVQAAVASAKSDAERGRREFEARRRAEEQSIQARLGEGLARLQKELATAKAKAAVDVSRAQVQFDPS